MPRTELFWRTAGEVAEVLETPPDPIAVQSENYLPAPCLLHPEQVTEYPSPLELDVELSEELEEWGTEQRATDDPYYEMEETYYSNELSLAPVGRAEFGAAGADYDV
jgi:hypothetical protein